MSTPFKKVFKKIFRVIYRVIYLRNLSEKQEKYFFLKIKNNARNGLIPSVWRKSAIYKAFLKVAPTGPSPVSSCKKSCFARLFLY